MTSASPDPAALFHYTDQQGLIGISSSRSVWASGIRYLNDGREFALCLDLVREAADELRDGLCQKDKLLLDTLVYVAGNVHQANVCVASFTEQGDLLSQWRGYCTPGDGFSVGMPTALLRESVAAAGWHLTKCVYDGATQRQLVAESLSRHFARMRAVTDGLMPPPVTVDDAPIFRAAWPFAAEVTALAPAIKDPSFSEEQEWRAISPPLDFRKLAYRTGRHTLIPYATLPLVGLEQADVLVRVGPTQYPELSAGATGGLLMSRKFTAYTVLPSTVPFRDW